MSRIMPELLAKSSNHGDAIKGVIMYDLTTRFIPGLLTGIGRFVSGLVQRRAKKLCQDVRTTLGANGANEGKIKTCVMVIDRNFKAQSGATNDMFDAVLSLASDIPETKYIKRTAKGIFVVDTTDEIKLATDVYFSKISTCEEDGEIDRMSIQVYSYSLDIVQLRDYLNDLEIKYLKNRGNQLGRQLYYFDEMGVIPPMKMSKNDNGAGADAPHFVPDLSKALPCITFNMFALHTNKSLKNIYGKSVRQAKKRVDFFVNNENWYRDKGIPYTLGFLIYGLPGCGKTSFIKALAKDTGRHVVNLKLGPTTTIQQINNLFYTPRLSVIKDGATCSYDIPMDKRIMVMEDVDCLSCVMARDDSNSANVNASDSDPNQLNLSVLLNIFDGVLETPGRIIVMTSNQPHKLDKALKRPGRIDVSIEFERCSAEDILDIFEGTTNITIDHIKYAPMIPGGKWTPAEVTKVIFENMDEPMNALHYFCSKQVEQVDTSNYNYTSTSACISASVGASACISAADMSTIELLETNVNNNKDPREIYNEILFAQPLIMDNEKEEHQKWITKLAVDGIHKYNPSTMLCGNDMNEIIKDGGSHFEEEHKKRLTKLATDGIHRYNPSTMLCGNDMNERMKDGGSHFEVEAFNSQYCKSSLGQCEYMASNCGDAFGHYAPREFKT